MGVKVSKRYSYKWQAKRFQTCVLKFPLDGTHKTSFEIFEILSF